MPFKWGNNSVQKYILDYGGKHTVTKYNFNNKTAWTSGGSDYDEEATPAEYFVFSVGEGGWSIKPKDIYNLPSEVIIPKVYQGIPVTSIDDYAFKDCKIISRVIIPDSVTYIGESAFYLCPITKVNIPNSVTYIGSWAFNSTDLTIVCEADAQPESWDSGWNTFGCTVVWGCSDSTTDASFIYTLLNNDTYSIKAKDINALIKYYVEIPSTYNGKAVTVIEDLAFSHAMISAVHIPEGITSIGYASFNGCTNLKEVNTPASVTSIGEQAFNGCNSLATFDMADNSQLTTIGAYAFNNCSALPRIVIPASVTTIGEYAFKNCSSLTISCEASYKPSGWATTWASGCSVIWGSILLGDDYLIFTELEDGTYSVEAKVNNKDNMPTKVALPSIYNDKAITSIGEFAFLNCTRLISIIIPDSVTYIGDSAFRQCSSLTRLTIPDSVTYIGDYVFSSCDSLTIYCEAASQPNGWASNWNYYNNPVVWGY